MPSRTMLLASLVASTLSLAQGMIIPRAVIDHDKVVGFAETVPDDTIGEMYLAYKPYLYVVNGCVPYPGVDAEGNTSGGLAPTGSPSGGCSSSTGQVYARANMTAGTSGTEKAIMYAWYAPKDEPSDGLGHRHEWEGVIVWLNDASSTDASNVVAVCPSAHGAWDCSTDSYTLSGTHPLIKYYSIWPIDHHCGLTDTVGGMQPLIAWESLTDAAQTALQNTDFGKANVPFKDGNFVSNLDKATY
ncbi:hypothetical protein P175DRAFT_0283550 [Aspergillus ochraceoroseus IBT 24754]|uniref:NPP1 domain protein n=3 Tax=Aspergillus subgen. Nidulantes TaxID=2720870 RepID=A0A0F8XJP3_9EURO|nr:uncharacterized protein P175DRAFT_0283550 [Aspergillus ochraceoroseus IBT 24754]KKK21383.1 hypothetical protein AOCH_000721 [Aspergillus ochraceoroseus]KKK23767.1 hypothetical protein ARAM_007337 [Aspergillus rambellii]PTU20392.1 hypothetical protein P175DRAFT_0283550 [Aspergillus ochraceoroseus IBT 24754]